jgi:hypothetical protein
MGDGMKHTAAKGCTDDGTLIHHTYMNTHLGLISWRIVQIDSQMLQGRLKHASPLGIGRLRHCGGSPTGSGGGGGWSRQMDGTRPGPCRMAACVRAAADMVMMMTTKMRMMTRRELRTH